MSGLKRVQLSGNKIKLYNPLELLAPIQEKGEQIISSCKFFLAKVQLVYTFETLKLWPRLTDF